MNKLLVLGTGNPQRDLILCCKAMGFEVFACSYSRGGAGETAADHFALIDIVDVEAVKQYVMDNQINYIYSAGSDLAMYTVGAVSEACHLPRLFSSETALICNHKGLLRSRLGQSVPWNIRHQILDSRETPLDMNFPFIMKPVDSQGQRGVSLVHDYSEFVQRYESCVSHSRAGQVIIEEYVDGPEISVNTYSVNGTVLFRLISDRIVWDGFTGGIIHKHRIPSERVLSGNYEKQVNHLVEQSLKNIGLENGPAYFQIKLGKQGPKVIEITPRLDGCHMWRLIEQYAGINLLDCSVRHLTGDLSFVHNLKTAAAICSQTAYQTEFLCQPPETAFDREHFDISDAIYHEWYYENGDLVRRMNGCMEKCGYKIYKENI